MGPINQMLDAPMWGWGSVYFAMLCAMALGIWYAVGCVYRAVTGKTK